MATDEQLPMCAVCEVVQEIEELKKAIVRLEKVAQELNFITIQQRDEIERLRAELEEL
jgi:predicted RNase H-like nuclease (RuvC/YqgF family)